MFADLISVVAVLRSLRLPIVLKVKPWSSMFLHRGGSPAVSSGVITINIFFSLFLGASALLTVFKERPPKDVRTDASVEQLSCCW